MGCGCGGQNRIVQYNRNQPTQNAGTRPSVASAKVHVPTQWKPIAGSIVNKIQYCPACKSPMRITNKFDMSTKTVIKVVSCPNPLCTNK